MPEDDGRAMQEPGAAAAEGAAAVQWRRTLWVMVGIQFIMTGAFSMLSPIMPLLPELGVETASAVDLWAGILNGVTSFVAAFASPVWGRVADRRGRKLMLLRSSVAIGVFTALMGVAANVWQFFCVSRADGRVRRIFQCGNRAGGEPSPGAAARLCPRLAQHRPARGFPGGSADRRRIGRSDRQLPHSVLLHLGDDPAVAGSGLVCRR
jgi:Major Facilitator Superfamily